MDELSTQTFATISTIALLNQKKKQAMESMFAKQQMSKMQNNNFEKLKGDSKWQQ